MPLVTICEDNQDINHLFLICLVPRVCLEMGMVYIMIKAQLRTFHSECIYSVQFKVTPSCFLTMINSGLLLSTTGCHYWLAVLRSGF